MLSRAVPSRHDPIPATRQATRMLTIPMVLIAVLVLAAVPVWPWSRGWGWAPAGMLAMGLATMVVFSLSVVPE